MEKLVEIIKNFTSHPGVSGNESMAFEQLGEYLKSTDLFDEIDTTCVGSIFGVMRCGKENAPLLLLDAHLDTIGFVITEICEGGFLKVAPIGGVAAKILSAAPVNIYGKKTIEGVFSSKPPHLQQAGESEQKLDVLDMCIDTGMTKEALEELVRVGTPVGLPCELTPLANDKLAGAGFDDRLCGAVFVRALSELKKTDLDCDVAFVFSGGEETGYKGAMTSAYRLDPTRAIVMDVTHAYVPGAPEYRKAVYAGKGCDICFSPQTNRAFTKRAAELAEKKGIPVQFSAAPGRTGTNSNAVQTTRNGIPVLLVSIPLKNMHTMSEIVDLGDAMSAVRLVQAVIEDM